MCARYSFNTSPAELAELLHDLGIHQLPLSDELFEPRYNIAPTDEMPVLRMDGGNPALERMRWGLVPFWAPDLKVGVKMINARCETIREKPGFRKAVQSRRCLVPASGFYEWITLSSKVKQPIHIRRADGRPLVFAGVWEEWGPREEPTRTYSVITTAANALMEPIHNRMPVILSGEAACAWLDPGTETARACGAAAAVSAGVAGGIPGHSRGGPGRLRCA